MSTCPYCGDGGKPYGNGKSICVRCGSVWSDGSAASNQNSYSGSSGSYSGSSYSGSSSGMGCGGKLFMLFIFMYLGQQIGGSKGATIGLVIGLVLCVFK